MSSTNPLNAGDVNVDVVTVSGLNGSNPLGIRNQVREIVIYESIFSNFLHGSLVIQDAIGLMSKYPIVGEELLSIEFGLQDDSIRKIRGQFLIFSVEEIDRSSDNKSQAYILKFCSVEKLQDVVQPMNAYNNTIDSIVRRIVQYNLQSNKAVNTERTLGVQEIAFPSSVPSKSIDFLSRRAISSLNRSSSFLFFERLNEGFVFKTVEQLIRESSTRDEYFLYPERTIEARARDFFTVQDFYFDSRFNTLDKLVNGLVDSELLQYDLVTKKQTSTTFKYRDVFREMTHVDSRVPGKLNTDGYLSLLEDNSSLDATKNEYTYIVDDSSRPKTFLEKSYGHRKVFFNSLQQVQGTIAVPGLPDRKAGDVITLKIPPMEGDTDTAVDQDNFVSGDFLVTNIKHTILNNQKYSMTLDLTKDCYRTKINV